MNNASSITTWPVSTLQKALSELLETQKCVTLEEAIILAEHIFDIKAELRKRSAPKDPRIIAGRQNLTTQE